MGNQEGYNVSTMDCPYCGFDDSRVIDSRDVDEGIRRRRQCLRCESRFTTYERIQPVNLFVIKKDERRELFDRQKVLNGIRKACDKRPLTVDTLDKTADDIEAELYHLGKAEVTSRMVGDMVMKRLKELDHKEEVDTLLENKDKEVSSTTQLPLLPDTALEMVTGKRRGSRK
jgi:transcriptional repressor NrdR